MTMKVKNLHSWNVSVSQAKEIQKYLKENNLILKNEFKEIKTIAGADVSFSKYSDTVFAAVILMSYENLEIIEKVHSVDSACFPYVPGYLSFREVPVLLKAFEKLKDPPDIIICDGHGIAHPRGFGLASHLGVILDIPSIGVAKKKLVGEHEYLGNESGSKVDLIYNNSKVGIVLRSRTNVKPVYISPGHKVGFEDSLEIVKKTIRKYRLAEPIRAAHKYVNEIRKLN